MNPIEDVVKQISKDCEKIIHRYFVSTDDDSLQDISSNARLMEMAIEDINHVLFCHAHNELELLFEEKK